MPAIIATTLMYIPICAIKLQSNWISGHCRVIVKHSVHKATPHVTNVYRKTWGKYCIIYTVQYPYILYSKFHPCPNISSQHIGGLTNGLIDIWLQLLVLVASSTLTTMAEKSNSYASINLMYHIKIDQSKFQTLNLITPKPNHAKTQSRQLPRLVAPFIMSHI